MQVVKKINNNVALCIDENGNELIAYSKGIGFNKQIPYELSDLSLINRTFYQVKKEYYALINEIPANVLEDTLKILNYIQKELSGKVNKSLFFILADHINFTINRAKNGLYIKNGMTFITQADYPEEMRLAFKIVNWLNERYNINLPNDEACYIAFHIIEAEETTANSVQNTNDNIIDECRIIVEKQFNIKIETGSFFYTRFVLHIKNLIFRKNEATFIIADNEKLFDTLRQQCEESYQCSLQMSKLFKEKMNIELTKEELVYLMLHINQLKSRGKTT